MASTRARFFAVACLIGAASSAASCGGDTSDDRGIGGSGGSSAGVGGGSAVGGSAGAGALGSASTGGEVSVCTAKTADCNGDPGDGCEVNLLSDWANCGAYCWAWTCIDGECPWECGPGYTDCDLAKPWCETDIANDPSNCGQCGEVCAPGQACVNRMCCEAGFGDCNENPNDGCEIEVRNDGTHCGACGNACASGQICVNGSCMCAPGRGDCNANTIDGCEIELASDPQHCGACGKACTAGQSCDSAICG